MPDLGEFLQLLSLQAGYISGQALAKKAGISRSAVWKRIRALRMYGYSVESRHGFGYRLGGQTDLPLPWELARILNTSFVGKHVVFLQRTDSTQKVALSLATKPDSHGTVVIAEQQASGRGRQKRKWLSPKGGIWLSVVLKPDIPTAKIAMLSFAASLAVCKAIRAIGLDARLKWPNDVVICNKKVAGILLDISAEADQVNHAVIGIGINANVDASAISLRLDGTKVTSISDELGHVASKLALTRALLENLECWYLDIERRGTGIIVREWKKNSVMLGRKISVKQNSKTIHGIAADINEDGSLLLRTDNGDINVVSGDIKIRY
jgi:BirA family transcriptional regulator, biotin operon repressor / biotin---[acetyl-CoA-carboxylase] ligase